MFVALYIYRVGGTRRQPGFRQLIKVLLRSVYITHSLRKVYKSGLTDLDCHAACM